MSVALVMLAVLGAPEPAEAPRILTIGGPVTEIVFALGAGDHVVGVDKSSLFPAEATTRASVGYFRSFAAEGALALSPTLVLAMEGAGPPAALDALRAAGVRVELVPEAHDIAGARARVTHVAALLDRTQQGGRLLSEMPKEPPPRLPEVPSVVFVYARGGGTLNVSGKQTAAHAMIELAGARNAIEGFEGFRPLTTEALVAAAPDVILMTEHGLASIGGAQGARALPGVALTPAGRSGRIVSVPDLLLLGFGPRLGSALDVLRAELTRGAPAP